MKKTIKFKFSGFRFLIASALLVFGLSFAGALALPLASSVHAAEEAESGSTMAVSPMWQEIILSPGENWTGSIRVQNPATSEQTLKFEVSVGSYSEHSNGSNPGDYGAVDLQNTSSYNQIMNWITINQPTGELAPNESVEVPFTVNVPSDAPGGGQYASIVVKDVSDKNSNQGNVTIDSVTQIASILYAEITGETHEEAEVLENSIPAFSLTNQINATSLVQNNGNVHGDINYTYQVWPLGSNEEVCTDEEDNNFSIILPETKLYHVAKCEVSPVGIYRAKQTVSIFGEVSEVERIVIVCPVWLIILIIILIIAIIILIVRAIRRKSKKSHR